MMGIGVVLVLSMAQGLGAAPQRDWAAVIGAVLGALLISLVANTDNSSFGSFIKSAAIKAEDPNMKSKMNKPPNP